MTRFQTTACGTLAARPRRGNAQSPPLPRPNFSERHARRSSGSAAPDRLLFELKEEDVITLLLRDRVRLTSVAWNVLRDRQAAEDMFQDTVVKATQRVNYFDDEKALAGWATLTIRNAAIDRHRQIKTRSNILEQIALQKLEEQRPDHHTPGQDSDRLDALMLCFQRLPEESRQILHRRYTLGESGDEIARDLKISKDAVYQRLSRLHRQLRSMIEDELVRLDASSSPPSQPTS